MRPDLRPTNARQVPEGRPRAFSAVAAAGWGAAVFALSLSGGLRFWDDFLDQRAAWRESSRATRPISQADAAETSGTVESGAPRRRIDGVILENGEQDPVRHYAVMIDDIPVARPQAGITDASVVYEAPVEGGLTRWMAVFADTATTERIGPVRSARPYFIDWAREYDALYTHVGGSPEALEKIGAADMRDLNEFSAGNYFVRDRRRDAPHNAYTSMEELREADTTRYPDRAPFAFRGWSFKGDLPRAERPTAQTVTVSYDHPNVDATWTYDPETNEYARSRRTASVDENGVAIRAKNIIVQFTDIATIDHVGRQRVRTMGEGEALVIVDGNAYAGKWHKASATARTVFTDPSGDEVRLNAGPTWIQVVAIGSDVDITP